MNSFNEVRKAKLYLLNMKNNGNSTAKKFQFMDTKKELKLNYDKLK